MGHHLVHSVKFLQLMFVVLVHIGQVCMIITHVQCSGTHVNMLRI